MNSRPANMAVAAAAAVNRHGSAGRMEGISRQSRVGPGGAVKVLECGVCEDVFTLQGDKVPRLLLCGHTVCHDCLTRLPLHGRAIRCPFDRQVTELGDSGVWGLKKNFALLELLERLQNGASGQSGSSEESVGGYGEHEGQGLGNVTKKGRLNTCHFLCGHSTKPAELDTGTSNMC